MKGRYLIAIPIVLFAAAVLMPIVMLYGAAGNRPPVVSNVHAEQRPGTKLVDITYDVEDPDGDLLTISVEISDERPVHTVYVDSFYMDKYEVTNEMYAGS